MPLWDYPCQCLGGIAKASQVSTKGQLPFQSGPPGWLLEMRTLPPLFLTVSTLETAWVPSFPF